MGLSSRVYDVSMMRGVSWQNQNEKWKVLLLVSRVSARLVTAALSSLERVTGYSKPLFYQLLMQGSNY